MLLTSSEEYHYQECLRARSHQGNRPLRTDPVIFEMTYSGNEINNKEDTMKRNGFELVTMVFVALIFVLASGCSPKLIYKKPNVLTPPVGYSFVLSNDGKLFVISGIGITSIDPITGNIIWGPVTPPQCSNYGGGDLMSIGENGLVYAVGDWGSCGDGRLAAFLPDDGSILWNIGTSDSCYSPHPRNIALNDSLGSVYFGSSCLFSVDLDNGSKNWLGSGGYYIGGSGMAIDSDNNIYYAMYNGNPNVSKIRSFTSDGTFRWEKSLSGRTLAVKGIIDGNKLVIDYYTYTGNPPNDVVMAVLDSDGNELWEASNLCYDGFVTDKNGNIYSTGSTGSDIVCLSATGKEIWRKAISGLSLPINVQFVDDAGHLYAISGKTLYAIFRCNGSIAWKFEADNDIVTTPCLISGGRTLFADSQGTLYLLGTSVNYDKSAWPITRYGDRRHTRKVWTDSTLP
jgi:hypothetical protein